MRGPVRQPKGLPEARVPPFRLGPVPMVMGQVLAMAIWPSVLAEEQVRLGPGLQHWAKEERQAVLAVPEGRARL